MIYQCPKCNGNNLTMFCFVRLIETKNKGDNHDDWDDKNSQMGCLDCRHHDIINGFDSGLDYCDKCGRKFEKPVMVNRRGYGLICGPCNESLLNAKAKA